MKKLIAALLAAAGLCVGAASAKAEGTGTRFNSGYYNLYKSSDAVQSATGQTVLAGPAILHKVIISSAAAPVGVSTNAVFQIYDGQSGSGTLRAEVNVSTQSLSTGVSEYTFDIAMSSGIWTDFSGSGTSAKVNLIYSRPRPASDEGYRVWSSSYMVADTSVHNITRGPVLLKKIIVLTKGTGTSILTAFDSYAATPATATARIAAIDLTDTAREYNYNILCSSGITVQASGAGTVNPYFIILYKKNPTQDYEVWKATFTTGSATTISAASGSDYVLGGVINGDSVTASQLSIYDSNAVASNLKTVVDGTTSFDRKMYDLYLSSGVTFSSTGNGLYTILYKRRTN